MKLGAVRALGTLAVLTFLLAGCDDDVVSPTTGTLEVRISGLPAGTAALVTVTGPSGYSRTLTATTTIPDLPLGRYTIAPAIVTSPDGEWTPTPATQEKEVTPGSGLALAEVAYAVTTARLAVNITGLPNGVNADVRVTGPGYNSVLTSSTAINFLTPGTYTVTAADVSSGGTTYRPAPAAQTIQLAASTTQIAANVIYAAASPLVLGVQQVTQGLFSPVYLSAPANDPRLFIVEQEGRIRIFKNGVLLATPFLDISARVIYGGERGLLSLAFDPAYATNGRFYVYYTGANGDIFVDRHTVSANPDVANTAFDQVITIQHRLAGNHNGGLVTFGPDGMLYLATGDGGSTGDPQNNAQNISSLLGKLLRLNVTNLPYTIPAGNPFVGATGADEIWAYGLRNPWRYAFDAATGQLYIADVGQGAWEEVNAVVATTAGVNYGWRIMEGAHCYNASTCNMTSLTLPVLEYDHGQGCSITGGFVYRGAAIPELTGHYFYSDYCTGFLRSFRLSGGQAIEQRDWTIGNISNILSFGVDAAGEMYMLSANGRVYRIVKP